MGSLTYGGTHECVFDDRTLAHLQIVFGLKLRRREGFFFSWNPNDGRGRLAFWIDPGVALRFHYDSTSAPRIDRERLQALALACDSPCGLTLDDSRVTRT